MAAPYGWVSPRWPSLSRRPLFLGLPYLPAGCIFLVWLFAVVVLRLFMPATILLLAVWAVGAALTRYDPYGVEILVGAMKMPRVLR